MSNFPYKRHETPMWRFCHVEAADFFSKTPIWKNDNCQYLPRHSSIRVGFKPTLIERTKAMPQSFVGGSLPRHPVESKNRLWIDGRTCGGAAKYWCNAFGFYVYPLSGNPPQRDTSAPVGMTNGGYTAQRRVCCYVEPVETSR